MINIKLCNQSNSSLHLPSQQPQFPSKKRRKMLKLMSFKIKMLQLIPPINSPVQQLKICLNKKIRISLKHRKRTPMLTKTSMHQVPNKLKQKKMQRKRRKRKRKQRGRSDFINNCVIFSKISSINRVYFLNHSRLL